MVADIGCEKGQGEAYVEPGHEAMTLGDAAQLSSSHWLLGMTPGGMARHAVVAFDAALRWAEIGVKFDAIASKVRNPYGTAALRRQRLPDAKGVQLRMLNDLIVCHDGTGILGGDWPGPAQWIKGATNNHVAWRKNGHPAADHEWVPINSTVERMGPHRAVYHKEGA